ncbi:GntR family transcriptional regulator [Neorhodopirellula pilleata]|uniref:Putative HTH-type transcriptional regulator YdfH n=1 Tax=Neorhodopirellula pilleata TaxID=2714738 RepID=A0A5C6ALA3_9BACT|nr:GntR family transcriptional regulator [Neorhodopirellula pilleata]TWT98953.1 putative HTH-type transcriptional regulator YdfH [Neorhodopirellula pilleata]
MAVNRIAAAKPSKTNGKAQPDVGTRLSEQVYESLVEMIVRGKLEPGQTVSEVELARLLSVSRTPIHEAVKQLVKDGLVVQAANRRPVVVSFGPEDVRDIYEMRRILESEAAAKAADRIDRPTIQRLSASLDDFRQSQPTAASISVWVKLDDEFHSAIASAAGSPRLAADIVRYRMMNRVFNRSHTDAGILQQAAQEHQAILDALRERDADAARRAMCEHLEEWQRFFANHLR